MIPLLTSELLSKLLENALKASTKPPPHLQDALPRLNTYLSTLAKSSDSGLQDIAVREFSGILRTQRSRELFWIQRRETVDPLVDILRAAAGAGRSDAESSTLMNGGTSIRSVATESGLSGGVSIQLLYHVLLVFWQVSFEGDMVGEGLDRYGYIYSGDDDYGFLTAITETTTSFLFTSNCSASLRKKRSPVFSSQHFTIFFPPTAPHFYLVLSKPVYPHYSAISKAAISLTLISLKISKISKQCSMITLDHKPLLMSTRRRFGRGICAGRQRIEIKLFGKKMRGR